MKTLILFLVLTFTASLNAQITKGNWLVGGDIAFSYTKSKPESTVDSKAYDINISPNVGYFFWDKLALGLRLNYFMSRYKSDRGTAKYDSFLVSPIVKYYFMDTDKMVNPFIESSYRFSLINESNSKEFSAKGGIAIFLNHSVALEIALNYLNLMSKNEFVGNHTFLLGFGIQVHLEKL